MRRPKKHCPITQAEMARRAGVTCATLRSWRDRENLDITDLEAVRKRASMKQARPDKAPSTDTGETFSEARRRREVANANRAEVLAEREANRVIDVASVDALFGQLGAELRGRLLAMRSQLVAELEGQDAANIYRILHDRICEVLEAIHSNRPIPKS